MDQPAEAGAGGQRLGRLRVVTWPLGGSKKPKLEAAAYLILLKSLQSRDSH